MSALYQHLWFQIENMCCDIILIQLYNYASMAKQTPRKKNGGKKKMKPEDIKKQLFSQILTVMLVFAIIITLFSINADNAADEKISISQLAAAVAAEQVSTIEVTRSELEILYKDGTEKTAKREAESSLSESLTNFGVTQEQLQGVDIKLVDPSGFVYFLERFMPFLFPLLLLGLIFYFFIRTTKGAGGGGAMQAFSFGQSRAKFIDPKDTKNRITFKDVAGAKEAKEELLEIVDFLKNPKKFHEIGAEIPKGVLMMGAPGTGKTLLARAVAGEAKVPFFSVSGSEFVEMFVGVGASRVRDLFKNAKKESPAIIFIDEIDAIGRARGGGTGGGNDEREQTLNQILVEMDGFDKTEKVIIIAATNRPEILDPALLRPGRFDRRVTIDLPDVHDRKAILEIHARKKPLTEDVDLEVIAKRTPGFSGADLYSLMNEGAILAAREERKQVSQYDLIRSIEKVMLGPERKSHILNENEKKVTAYHEVGHALMGSVLEHANPVHKVTVVSRGSAAGYTLSLPDEDRKMRTKNDFLADIAMALGGYVTEQMIFGDVSTGPSNDLQVATGMARNMVTKYGMSKKVGVLALEGRAVVSGGGMEGTHISAATQSLIDEEVRRIMSEAYKLTEKTLKKYEKALHGISHTLLEVETLEREEYEAQLKEYGVPLKNRAMKEPKGYMELSKKSTKRKTTKKK